MTALNIDSDIFARILANNPCEVSSALRLLAFEWARGPLDPEDLDLLNDDGSLFAEKLAKACGSTITHGTQHIPAFLRTLADQIEFRHVEEVIKHVESSPLLSTGMGEVFKGWLERGFPEPGASLFHERIKSLPSVPKAADEPEGNVSAKYGWLADPASVISAAKA